MYRVKEFNSVYDPYFVEGKGWIFITNKISFWEAILFILYQKKIRNSVFYYETTPIMQLQLMP
jgi:hypothetical protein